MIDSHAHLGADAFDTDRTQIIERARQAGISHILNIATDKNTLDIGLELSNNFPWILLAGSTTPHDVETLGEKEFGFFEKAAKDKKLAAVGETGLDYYYEHSPKELQQHFCKRYFHLAKACKLPVIIHCRDAFSDLLKLLDAEYSEGGKVLPGVLHCFTGTPKEAEELIKRGFTISFSGIATFKKSEALREALDLVPLPQLLIETDAPYLAPMPHRGKRNEPAFVTHTAALVAERKKVTPEALEKQLLANFQTLFL